MRTLFRGSTEPKFLPTWKKNRLATLTYKDLLDESERRLARAQEQLTAMLLGYHVIQGLLMRDTLACFL